MINQLKLENFKCFKNETTFDLSRVNIFAGYNGRGKSTVIQSLLLLSQSQYHYRSLHTLEVNGEYVNLGLFKDLIHLSKTHKSSLKINLKTDQKEGHDVRLAYKEKNEAERLGQISKLWIDGRDYLIKKVSTFGEVNHVRTGKIRAFDDYPDSVNAIFRDCNYVAAERKGPSLYEEKRDLNAYNPVGRNGENLLNTIERSKKLNPEEINYWVSHIMEGGGIELTGKKNDSAVLSLKMSMPNAKDKYIKAINCGFGYSYVLSIVINALTMERGTLIIENPEAHLHPQAQFRLTELLSKILDKDIQIFIETHSEHIVNGFRICALRDDINMNHTDLSIYFFDVDYSINHLHVEANGRIKNWPNGFFDQFEWEMTEIINLGNKVKC